MLAVSRRTAAQINSDIQCRTVCNSHQFFLRLTYLIVNPTKNISLRKRKIVLHPCRWQPNLRHRACVPCLQEGPTSVAIDIRRYDENTRQGGLFNPHSSPISDM